MTFREEICNETRRGHENHQQLQPKVMYPQQMYPLPSQKTDSYCFTCLLGLYQAY